MKNRVFYKYRLIQRVASLFFSSIVIGLHFEFEFIVLINYCTSFRSHCEIVTGHGFE